jgi:hypothetical protein
LEQAEVFAREEETMSDQDRVPRSRHLQDISRDLDMCVARLDALQAGGYRGVISPVKQQLATTVRSVTDALRKIALQEYNDEQGKGGYTP